MAFLNLHFSDQKTLALDTLQFFPNEYSEPRVSRRGKGLHQSFGRYTFQWSPAVRAMSVLSIWTKAGYFRPEPVPTLQIATLCGGSGTLAASLDYALSKRPLWLLDMFGVNAHGDAIARGLFIRHNSERKRGGEVTVALNPHHIEAKDILIHLDGQQVSSGEALMLLSERIQLDDQLRQTSKIPPFPQAA